MEIALEFLQAEQEEEEERGLWGPQAYVFFRIVVFRTSLLFQSLGPKSNLDAHLYTILGYIFDAMAWVQNPCCYEMICHGGILEWWDGFRIHLLILP